MHVRKPAGSIWLLESGADVHATDKVGKTALHHAAAQEVRADYVERLLAADADPLARDADGKTPVRLCQGYSREKKRAKLVDLLG